MKASKRIDELRERIARADQLYYNEGTPELADSEYDDLFRELVALEKANPELASPESPTQRVGAPLPKGSRFETENHRAPMLSIESLTSEEQVVEFDARAKRQLEMEDDDTLRWCVEPKFDGVSASLLYENGVLVRGLSRGDGAAGEVITQNLRTIRSVPLRLATDNPPPVIEVRGEVLLSRSAFDKLREISETTTDSPFRNARNTVAGTLKLLDPRTVAERGLEFICWGVGHVEGIDVESYVELRDRLQQFGFFMAKPFETVDSIQGVIDYHAEIEARRDSIEHEMDGIVAKVERLELQRQMGRTARTPRWILAYKFAAKKADTVVEDIKSQVGRTGAVTPVAELAPTDLAGVTVRRASLHNWVLLAERDVRVGDHVLIQRAGDVIPEIVKVYEEKRPADSQPVVAPDQCPSCESPLQLDGAHLYCLNVECPAQLKGRIVHMASRRALDIDRLGPKYVDQLMEANLIQRLEDVFTLTEREDDILDLERWGERSYAKLEEEIEKAKQPTFMRFLYSLGIRHVGEQTARDLTDAFADFESLRAADEEGLVEVDGVGPEVAKSIRAFFELEGNQRFLEHAFAAGLTIQVPEKQNAEGPLIDRVFCFTGGLKSLSRDDARAMVEAMGATTATSLTKKVTDVVLGEKAGSKADKAKKMEINTLTEEQFLELVKE